MAADNGSGERDSGDRYEESQARTGVGIIILHGQSLPYQCKSFAGYQNTAQTGDHVEMPTDTRAVAWPANGILQDFPLAASPGADSALRAGQIRADSAVTLCAATSILGGYIDGVFCCVFAMLDR